MFAITVCRNCGRNRITDLASETAACPYCSIRTEIKSIRVLAKFKTAREAREALCSATLPAAETRCRADNDPMSTLEYRYEKAKGIDRYAVLCSGLTEIKGTFTLDDVKIFEPEKAEKILELMIDHSVITEERPGRYKAL